MTAPGANTQHGYFVLADISGYTSYLAGVELEHAHEILSDLLETIVNRFRALLTISKLEGDAVFAYAPEAKLPRGETLLELIESTYMAFRDQVETVRRHTTCECNACRAIPALDLKFMIHYGDYIVQSVAGMNELVGSDVNLVHRLLKNHVSEATGWRAYTLFTEEGLAHIGVRPVGMHAQPEAYEHLGEVKTFSLNLHDRHTELVAARRVQVTPEEADYEYHYDFAVPPHMVWTWAHEPSKRVQWDTTLDAYVHAFRPAGRAGPGARNHCMHGKKVESIETILDWRPFEYWTLEIAKGPVIVTSQLKPTSDGNRTSMSVCFKGQMRMPKPLVRLMFNLMTKMFNLDKQFEAMNRLMVEELQQLLDRANTDSV